MRNLKKKQIEGIKEPSGLIRQDEKRSGGGRESHEKFLLVHPP